MSKIYHSMLGPPGSIPATARRSRNSLPATNVMVKSVMGKTGTTPPPESLIAPKRQKQLPNFRLSTQAGKKVSKVRWLNLGHIGIIPDASLPEYFVVGSWGEIENEASLWKLTTHETSRLNQKELNPELEMVQKFPVLGNVSDIVAVKNEGFALTTSAGVVSYFQLKDPYDNGLTPTRFEIKSSNVVHHFKSGGMACPATGLTLLDASVVTVGEDGSIYEVSIPNCEVIQSRESVDELSFYCVEYIVGRTVATGNNAGQVKIWDLRRGGRKPAQTLNNLEDFSGATSIAPHPSQPHILLVGYGSGGTDLWDLRGSASEPIANLQRQDGGLSEIFFHPICPDRFYTCSQNGEVIHWFTAEDLMETELVQNNDYDTDLNLGFLKKGLACKILYSSPFPINSVSLSRNNRLMCGGDSGMLFCTENF